MGTMVRHEEDYEDTNGHIRHVSETPLLALEEDSNEKQNIKDEEKIIKLDILEDKTEEDDKLHFPHEVWKTMLMCVWLLTGMGASTVSLILTNERHFYPGRPLPDIVLDNITYQSAGVTISEMTLVTAILTGFITVILHTHRSIIFRRLFFMAGLMYYYRAVTMSVTVLPKPDHTWNCPKSNSSLSLGDIWDKLSRVAVDGGISLTDKQQLCGDYIFSGHTMCLIMSYLTIKQYSPPGFYILHWFSNLLFISGVTALLAGRGHYTIDVILGYWIITRVWSIYHALADGDKTGNVESKQHLLRGVWWWRIFMFLEGQVPGPVPTRFSIPLPTFLSSKVLDLCGQRKDEGKKSNTQDGV